MCFFFFYFLEHTHTWSVFVSRGEPELFPSQHMLGFQTQCFLFVCLFLFCFLGQHLQHMEVPRLGVESELQLPAYTMATATQDPSLVCDLHHSSRQCWILNPLIEARDGACILMDASQICFH